MGGEPPPWAVLRATGAFGGGDLLFGLHVLLWVEAAAAAAALGDDGRCWTGTGGRRGSWILGASWILAILGAAAAACDV